MADSSASGPRQHGVRVPIGTLTLDGDLALPDGAGGLVLFAPESGRGRQDPRDRLVAEVLNAGGLATLLLDLLTPVELAIDRDTALLRFDVDLLAQRLVAATDWLGADPRTAGLPIGYFGAGTGAAAALLAAVERPDAVGAIVSRGGRVDLSDPVLPLVEAPTLLIVGGEDASSSDLNRAAMERLAAVHMFEIVPGAGPDFEETGALEQVAVLALAWFEQFLAG